MERLETEDRLDYKKLFTALVDTSKLICEHVGLFDGDYILDRDITINNSSGYGTRNEYYLLTPDEYIGYVRLARKNRQIGFFEARKLMKIEPDANETRPLQAGKVMSFEVVTLRETGMRGAQETEIVMKDGRAEVSRYGIRYHEGIDERVLDERAVCSEKAMLDILNRCKVLSWNGFHGKHPKGVLDGIMFRFNATVNGGEKIYADGSQNFPKKYYEFRDALYSVLHPDKGD